jgi:hypothetical protein
MNLTCFAEVRNIQIRLTKLPFMPKLIDYPRTTYAGAWELAEIVDDTGGKCAIETAARKLNRKVSGSFKAIIGSAVKFGLLTSKRDLLTTTTLFKRIKHAYDKQEELLFHREAFLTPPLFTQICRKFRSRELPVQMLDVMLIREFGVEEINAQGVAKAFVEGCRMVGLLDERNIIADIDALTNRPSPRRELASPPPILNTFRAERVSHNETALAFDNEESNTSELNSSSDTPIATAGVPPVSRNAAVPSARPITTPISGNNDSDAIASLFGLLSSQPAIQPEEVISSPQHPEPVARHPEPQPAPEVRPQPAPMPQQLEPVPMQYVTQTGGGYQIQVSGPGVNTTLSITDEDDITIAIALLQKIKRQLSA